MSRAIGYGEDALTYWALKERLALILEELEDHSAQRDCQYCRRRYTVFEE